MAVRLRIAASCLRTFSLTRTTPIRKGTASGSVIPSNIRSFHQKESGATKLGEDMAYNGPKSRRPMCVLVDMDCVMCDFEGYALQKFRERYPDEPYVALEDRNTFYLGDQYVKLGEHLPKKMNSVLHAEGFFRDIPPNEGAIDAVKELSGMDNIEVFFCTTAPAFYKYAATEKHQWVENHMGNDWARRVILTKDKTVINGDILIDDKAKITGMFRSPSWKQVLFTACHNKHLDHKKLGCIARLGGWTDHSVWKKLIEERRKELLL